MFWLRTWYRIIAIYAKVQLDSQKCTLILTLSYKNNCTVLWVIQSWVIGTFFYVICAYIRWSFILFPNLRKKNPAILLHILLICFAFFVCVWQGPFVALRPINSETWSFRDATRSNYKAFALSEKRITWSGSMACDCNMLSLLPTIVLGDAVIIPYMVSCDVCSHLIILVLPSLFFCVWLWVCCVYVSWHLKAFSHLQLNLHTVQLKVLCLEHATSKVEVHY